MLVIIILISIIMLIQPVTLEVNIIFNTDVININIIVSFLFGLLKKQFNPINRRKQGKVYMENLFKVENQNITYDIWHKLTLKKIVWNSQFGLGDAALTSIIYGLISTFKNYILSLILSRKTVQDIDIKINPIFNEINLHTQFNCIFEIKLVHIIIIWFSLLKTYIGGDNVDRTSNRRAYENYNE